MKYLGTTTDATSIANKEYVDCYILPFTISDLEANVDGEIDIPESAILDIMAALRFHRPIHISHSSSIYGYGIVNGFLDDSSETNVITLELWYLRKLYTITVDCSLLLGHITTYEK